MDLEKYSLTPIPPQYAKHETSLVFYRISDDQNFLCNDYDKLTDLLAMSLVDSDFNHDLQYNWILSPSHTVIFDIDVNSSQVQHFRNTFQLLMRYFDLVFLKVLEKHLKSCLSTLTLLLSMRRDGSGGLHIHCPGIEMSHDDYFHLCKLMSEECRFEDENATIKLNCPSNMCLVACDKPSSTPDRGLYIPVRLVRIRFETVFDEQIQTWKSKRVDSLIVWNDTPSLFSEEPFSRNEFLFETIQKNTSRDRMIELAKLMMPVEPPHKPSILLYFTTKFCSNFSRQYTAGWTSFADTHHAMYKNCLEKKLKRPGEEGGSYCYQFLKHHSESLKEFQTFQNRVLKTWYKRFRNPLRNEKEVGIFQFIDQTLRHRCVHLRNEESPLLTILKDSDGHYFLPVFYALYFEIEKKRKCNLVKHLLPLIVNSEPSLPHINEMLSGFEPDAFLPRASKELTMDTIIYCGYKAVPRETREGFFGKHIGLGWSFIFERIDTLSVMAKCLRWVQQNYFPIVKGIEPVSKTEKLYAWDPYLGRWIGMKNEDQVDSTIELFESIFLQMKYFDGFDKISKELYTLLNDDFVWMHMVAYDVLVELKNSKAIVGNELSTDWEKGWKGYEKVYGLNVPEYYFF